MARRYELTAVFVLGETNEDLSGAQFPPLEVGGLPSVQRLRDRGSMRVLINSYTPGLALRNEDSGRVEGFEIDLIKSLARVVFDSTSDIWSCVELVEAGNEEKINMLIGGDVDLIVANLTDTLERRRVIDFAGHYASMRFAPFLGPDSPDICTADDLNGLCVGVEGGSMDEQVLRQVAPTLDIRAMKSTQEWLDTYDSGQVQAYWGDTLVGSTYVRRPGSQLRQGSFKAGIGHSAMGVNKAMTDFKRLIDSHTASLLSSGQLTRSRRRWGL